MTAKAGSSKGSRSQSQPMVLGEYGASQPTGASETTSEGSETTSINLQEIKSDFLGGGGGSYQTGRGEVGAYGFRSIGHFVSIGGGFGGSSLNTMGGWGFISFEAEVPFVEGGQLVKESAFVFGGGLSSGLYYGDIQAQGFSVGIEGVASGAMLTGKETTTYVHPVDAIISGFKSLVGPISDPRHPLHYMSPSPNRR